MRLFTISDSEINQPVAIAIMPAVIGTSFTMETITVANYIQRIEELSNTKASIIDFSRLITGIGQRDSTAKHYMKLNNDKREALKQADAKITALRDLLVKENGKSHDLDVKLTEANNDIDYLKEELTATIADRDRYKLKVEATVADSRIAIDKCQAEINRLNAELVKANETTINAEFEAADAKNKLEDAKSNIQMVSDAYAACNTDLENLRMQYNQDKRIRALIETRAELKDAKSTIRNMKVAVDELYKIKADQAAAKGIVERMSQAAKCAAFSMGDHSKGSDGDVDLNAYTITKCISLFKNAPTAEVILHTTIGDIVIKLAK